LSSSQRGGWRVWALAGLPWCWFFIRDLAWAVTDVVAVILPGVAVAVVIALCIVAFRWRPAAVVAASTLAAASVAVVLPWSPVDPGSVDVNRSIKVAEANVADNASTGPSLVQASADVLIVAEMTSDLEPILSKAYPYGIFEDGKPQPDIGVYSRLPFRLLERPGLDLPGVRLEIDTTDGPFVLYALHIPRPWMTSGGYQVSVAEHRRLVRAVTARVAMESLPVVVVGDLNTSDRSHDYRDLLHGAALVDAMRAGWAAPTSTGKWAPLLLRIDHLLVGAGLCADDPRRLKLPGSDHRGIGATVGRCVEP
jgi:endonuclease/exonuclease/phosphatase (EEP) superfamily protein YafD